MFLRKHKQRYKASVLTYFWEKKKCRKIKIQHKLDKRNKTPERLPSLSHGVQYFCSARLLLPLHWHRWHCTGYRSSPPQAGQTQFLWTQHQILVLWTSTPHTLPIIRRKMQRQERILHHLPTGSFVLRESFKDSVLPFSASLCCLLLDS